MLGKKLKKINKSLNCQRGYETQNYITLHIKANNELLLIKVKQIKINNLYIFIVKNI